MTTNENRIEELVIARKGAEKVVEGMPEGPRKDRTYEVALMDLMNGAVDQASPSGRKRPAKRRREPSGSKKGEAKTRRAGGATPHINNLLEEGFFSEARTDVDTRERLSELALKFERNAVATTLFRLTRDGKLKRVKEARGETGRRLWAYSEK